MHHAQVELEYVAIRLFGIRWLEAAGDRTPRMQLHEVLYELPHLFGLEEFLNQKVAILLEDPDLFRRKLL